MEQTQNGISDERLAEIVGAGKLWCGDPGMQTMARELAALRKALSDPTTVHVNILRGTIALTKGQAIHIAGLPADIEEELTALRASHKMLVEALEAYRKRDTCQCPTCRNADATLADARKLEGK